MGIIKNADGIGKVGNIICGDVMHLYIKVKEDKKTGKKIIKDAKFQTFGCVAAIATTSILTDLVKGKNLEEAIKISRGKITSSLGGLPPVKLHCSALAVDALSEAVYDYLSKRRLHIPKELLKRHERIQNEYKLAEKKHKKYIKLGENILKG